MTDDMLDGEDHKVEFLKPIKKEQLNKPGAKKRPGLNTTEKIEHRERKRRAFRKSEKKREEDEPRPDDDTFENRGFAEWLQSPDGSGLMKLFVITNTALLLVTLIWPHLHRTYVAWRKGYDPDWVY